MKQSDENPVIEQIYQHASVRHYKNDPVPDKLIEELVAAGQRASTSSNLQTYSVVVTKDANQRARMQELCNNQKHISQAPIFLTWCADISRLERITKARGYPHASEYVENFLIAAVDAAIAMQNAALAAESFGLGICYIGAIRNFPLEVVKLLALPKLVFPIAGMTLGWPAKEAVLRPRLSLDAILHWEQYDSSRETDALRAYDEAMIATGIYNGRQIPSPGKNGGLEDYGWQEHSALRASQPMRVNLKAELKEQGFLLK